MLSLFKSSNEKGQGLVEYALILVLVAIVVIAILLVLGPTVSQVYCEVANGLQPGTCGIVISVTAERKPPPNDNHLKVTITVSESDSITVSDSQNGGSTTTTCNTPSCEVTLNGVGANAGTITVEDSEGKTTTVSYPAK